MSMRFYSSHEGLRSELFKIITTLNFSFIFSNKLIFHAFISFNSKTYFHCITRQCTIKIHPGPSSDLDIIQVYIATYFIKIHMPRSQYLYIEKTYCIITKIIINSKTYFHCITRQCTIKIHPGPSSDLDITCKLLLCFLLHYHMRHASVFS